jgi:mono/diheme cytochrome c family protein
MRAVAWFRIGALVLALAACACAADDATIQKGHQVYEKWCLPCHGAGEGKPGTIASAAHYKGSKPAVLNERTDLTPEMIKAFVRNGVYVMPRFRKTEITDAELDALAAYLTRTAKK